MTDHLSQPQQNDAVLGGQVPPTGVVLGGLEGVKQRLSSGVWEQQTAAVTQALQYGKAGLDLLLQALKQEEMIKLRWAIYWKLIHQAEPALKGILAQYNPYRSFQPLFTLEERDIWNKVVFAVSPDSQNLVTHNGGNETLKVWDLQTGNLLRSFQGERRDGHYFSTTMTISPDGQTCFIGDALHDRFRVGNLGTKRTYRIQIKHLSTGQTVGTLEGQGSQVAIAISPDGETLAVTTRRDGVQVWDLTTQRSHPFEHPSEHKFWFLGFVQFSPDGEHIINAAMDTISVWQRHTGKLLHTLTWKEGVEKHIAYISPNGETVVAISIESNLRQWNLQTGKLLLERRLHTTKPGLTGTFAAAFSPDGQTLLTTYSVNSGVTKLWHWQTGELLHSMPAHEYQYQHAPSASFSPNGQFAVTGSANGTIQVWGLPSEGNA